MGTRSRWGATHRGFSDRAVDDRGRRAGRDVGRRQRLADPAHGVRAHGSREWAGSVVDAANRHDRTGREAARALHEGTQLAPIRSGVLTYDVVSGVVEVFRKNGANEAAQGPATVRLRPGDAIV